MTIKDHVNGDDSSFDVFHDIGHWMQLGSSMNDQVKANFKVSSPGSPGSHTAVSKRKRNVPVREANTAFQRSEVDKREKRNIKLTLSSVEKVSWEYQWGTVRSGVRTVRRRTSTYRPYPTPNRTPLIFPAEVCSGRHSSAIKLGGRGNSLGAMVVLLLILTVVGKRRYCLERELHGIFLKIIGAKVL